MVQSTILKQIQDNSASFMPGAIASGAHIEQRLQDTFPPELLQNIDEIVFSGPTLQGLAHSDITAVLNRINDALQNSLSQEALESGLREALNDPFAQINVLSAADRENLMVLLATLDITTSQEQIADANSENIDELNMANDLGLHNYLAMKQTAENIDYPVTMGRLTEIAEENGYDLNALIAEIDDLAYNDPTRGIEIVPDPILTNGPDLEEATHTASQSKPTYEQQAFTPENALTLNTGPGF